MPRRTFYIALYDAANNHLTFRTTSTKYDTDFRQSARQGIDRIRAQDRPALLVTPEVHASSSSARGELIGPPSIDLVGVPLKIGDRTIGVLVARPNAPGVRYRRHGEARPAVRLTQVAMAIERSAPKSSAGERAQYRLHVRDQSEPMFVYDFEPCASWP